MAGEEEEVAEIFKQHAAALRAPNAADAADPKKLELPLARIKRIMKTEDALQAEIESRRAMMVSAEAPAVFAKACELFVVELTTRAWARTASGKRRTLQRQDVASAVQRCDVYDFLIDVVPRSDAEFPNGEDFAPPPSMEEPVPWPPEAGADAPAVVRAIDAATAAGAAAAAAALRGARGSSGAEYEATDWQKEMAARMYHAHVAAQRAAEGGEGAPQSADM